ncbi:protamine-2 [Callithrix jacchus]|uniref:Protamine-2 n=2 Tax=Callithrix jacchus TaxID=9483 RepID=PRM2_CALJA|nr:protamine-2 [Callithrix jacchus]XP_054098180.1 protamine-2 isoform X1 [Callithrix jacchus]Q28337.1 RecName: Full=Protamine-2; AltName: Full=Sperm histone P2; AltName: Full=Sperm protamine P2 [Callithrix jacchus]CAA59687.1 protamine p2 [Callithrix jacchus]
MVRYRVRSPSERPHEEYRQLVNWQEQGRNGQEEQGLSAEGGEVYGRTHQGYSSYRRRRCSRRRRYRIHRRRSRSCRRRRRRSCRYRRRPRRGCRSRRRRRCRRY